MRVTEAEWADTKTRLIERKLITKDNKPTAWEKRQMLSDDSKSRVYRWREKQKKARNGDCNVTVTAQDTDTDTDISTNVDIAASPKPKRAKPKSKITEDAQPSDRDRQAAADAELHGDAFRAEWRRFRDYHISRGSLMADWSAAWRTWLGNRDKFSARASPNSPKPANTGIAARALLELKKQMEFENGQQPQAVSPSETLECLPIQRYA
jgi:hypothetical protein